MIGLPGKRGTRDIVLQSLFLLAIVGVVAVVVVTARRNMQTQNLSMSWDFLRYTTGWDIAYSVLPYDISSTYARALTVGFVNTIFLGVISISLAIIIGTIFGTARTSPHKLINLIAATYVQIFRNIPLILQALFWYSVFAHLPSVRNAIALPGAIYISSRGIHFPGINAPALAFALMAAVIIAAFLLNWLIVRAARNSGAKSRPLLTMLVLLVSLSIAAGIAFAFRLPDLPLLDVPQLRGLGFKGGISIPPELSAAIVAISIFGGAYIAEIVRAGLLAIPRGQMEAASALGLTAWQTFRRIRAPLAIRIIMPTMTNQIIWLMKATTIGIAIGFSDFFGTIANSITHAGQTLNLIFILVIGFWIINLSISLIMGLITKAIAIPGRAEK